MEFFATIEFKAVAGGKLFCGLIKEAVFIWKFWL